MKDIFSFFKDSIFNPKKFFKKIKKEQSMNKALSYFVLLTLIALLFSTFRYLDNLNVFFGFLSKEVGLTLFDIQIPVTWFTFLVFHLSLVFLTVIFSFARFYFVHVFVYLFNNKAQYKDTYKALSYSVGPAYAGIPFFIAGVVFLAISRDLGFVIAAILMFLIYTFFEIYAFYIRSKALAEVQNIGFWKSFFSIYVLSNLLMGFLTLVLMFLLISIAIIFI